MKEITCQEITETLKTMCIEAATDLPKDVYQQLHQKHEEGTHCSFHAPYQ